MEYSTRTDLELSNINKGRYQSTIVSGKTDKNGILNITIEDHFAGSETYITGAYVVIIKSPYDIKQIKIEQKSVYVL